MGESLETRQNRLPLALHALGTFALGTTELVIVGLLPEVSGDLGVTIPTAGLLVTGFALSVVFGGPILTVATVGMPRKTLLLTLMSVFVVGNAVVAIAPSYTALMAGRIVSALAFGAFFGVANVVAVRLAGEERQVTAALTVFVFGVVAYVAVPVLAARIVQKAADAPTLASTANISAFNVANAGGAFLGGVVIGGGFGL
ncbi:MAG: MFS transporter, partial [Rubrobacteraceae bacterium]